MEVIRKSLRDSSTARWTALAVVAFTMLCGYYLTDVIATARVTIAQFGVVASLPEELLFGEYSIEFNTESGAIKNILKK